MSLVPIGLTYVYLGDLFSPLPFKIKIGGAICDMTIKHLPPNKMI